MNAASAVTEETQVDSLTDIRGDLRTSTELSDPSEAASVEGLLCTGLW